VPTTEPTVVTIDPGAPGAAVTSAAGGAADIENCISSAPTVVEISLRYLEYCDTYYRTPSGRAPMGMLHIRRVFQWAESQELVPRGTHNSLKTVEPLRLGRTVAPELPEVNRRKKKRMNYRRDRTVSAVTPMWVGKSAEVGRHGC